MAGVVRKDFLQFWIGVPLIRTPGDKVFWRALTFWLWRFRKVFFFHHRHPDYCKFLNIVLLCSPRYAPAEMNGQGPDFKLESKVNSGQVCHRERVGSRLNPGVNSYTAPFCRRSGVKQPLVLQLLSALLAWDSFLLAFQRWASGSINREREESR